MEEPEFHNPWKEYTIMVNHAGFTMGMAMEKNVRNSLAPSSRADSRTASDTEESMNCFIRYKPRVEPHAGTMTAQYVSTK